ncbi:MAG: hypothetical protein WB816_15515 [Methylocystis sp.]
MPSREELRKLLEKHTQPETRIEEVIQLAEDAFRRAAINRPARAELKIQASNLEKASREIADVIDSARDLHFFLRIAKTLATKELDTKKRLIRGLKERLQFDQKTKRVFQNLTEIRGAFETIAEACETLTDTNQAHPVLSREGGPVDEEKKQLGFELAAFWHWATGKVPAASGSASFDEPGTPFGNFVALAAETSGKSEYVKNGFAGFIRRTCADYRKSKLCVGVTGDVNNGVATAKKN